MKFEYIASLTIRAKSDISESVKESIIKNEEREVEKDIEKMLEEINEELAKKIKETFCKEIEIDVRIKESEMNIYKKGK